MFGTFGSQQFGSTWVIFVTPGVGGNIAVIGDTSTHGGSITNCNQDGTFKVNGKEVAVHGAFLSCPIHGVVSVAAITKKSYHNGKLILTAGAVATCGAVLTVPDRKVYVEK